MSKKSNEEREKRKLDLELDSELEGTFPASDPLKITRRPPERQTIREPSSGKKAKRNTTEK